jgi:peptidoglycan/xylan/chitin deacetylase (PgdA/CDA1 family)
MTRRTFALSAVCAAAAPARIPAKTVVLTFDDAVKSHRTLVAPLLVELKFGATFFVTHRWMDDRENFMTWRDIAEVHEMGFEIGNHSWTHANFSQPRNAARLAGELALVEMELNRVGVPKPVSFAYSGNGFGPEAAAALERLGIRYARRGGQPEVPYGKLEIGTTFRPDRHHRLLIPTTADAYPQWDLAHFRRAIARAVEGEAVVLQFHGVPDTAHPWVHTPPERFREYLRELKDGGFRVIALRDLGQHIGADADDPMLKARHPQAESLTLPAEMAASRADRAYWLSVMRRHRFTPAESQSVLGESAGITAEPADGSVLPYPGGRHPRIGFLDGAIDPLRGTKASVFLPWDESAYVIIDLPEAIFANGDLVFLAHTHLPTIWNDRNQTIENTDWTRGAEGTLSSAWKLPDGVQFGARITASAAGADMELWLRNGGQERLTGLRTQVCVLLAGAHEFAAQTSDNRVYRHPWAAVRSNDGARWIATRWEGAGRIWGNPQCPCIHSDPMLPDCGPDETVRVRGRLFFHQGRDIESLIATLNLPAGRTRTRSAAMKA